MNGSTYNARIGLEIAGEQEVSVDSFCRPAGQQSYLCVGIGPVLTYSHAREGVSVQVQAWTEALAAAGELFPANYLAPRPRLTVVMPGQPVIAAITWQPGDTWNVTGFKAGATRDGRPALAVRVGALTLTCRDLAAVASAHHGWADADRITPVLWPRRAGRPAAGTVQYRDRSPAKTEG